MKTIIISSVVICAWLFYNAWLFFKKRPFEDEKDDTPFGCFGRILMIAAMGAWAMIAFVVEDEYSKLLGVVLLIADYPFLILTSNKRWNDR